MESPALKIGGENLHGAMARITQRVIRLRKEVADYSGAFGDRTGEEDAAKPVFLSVKPTCSAQNAWIEREANIALLKVEKAQLQDEVASLKEELRVSSNKFVALRQETDEEVRLYKRAFSEIKEDFEEKVEEHDKLKIDMDEAANTITNLRTEAESLAQSLLQKESLLIETQQKNVRMLEQMKDFRDKVKENRMEMQNMKQLHLKNQEDLLGVMKKQQACLLNAKSKMLSGAQREVKELRHQLKRHQRESCGTIGSESDALCFNIIYSKTEAVMKQEGLTTDSCSKPVISLVNVLDELSDEDTERSPVNSGEIPAEPSLTILQKPSGFCTELGSEVQFGSACASDQDTEASESASPSSLTYVSQVQACGGFQDEACGDYYTNVNNHTSIPSSSCEYPATAVEHGFGGLNELEAFNEIVDKIRNRDRKTIGVVVDLLACSHSNPADKPRVACYVQKHNEHIAALSQEMCTLWKSLKRRLSGFVEQLNEMGILPEAQSTDWSEEDGESEQEYSEDDLMDDYLPCAYLPTFTYNRPLIVPVLELSRLVSKHMNTQDCDKGVLVGIPSLPSGSPSEDEEMNSLRGDEQNQAGRKYMTLHELCALEKEMLLEEDSPSKSTMVQLISNNKSLQADLKAALQELDQLQTESQQHEEDKRVATNQLNLVRVENLRLESALQEFEDAKVIAGQNSWTDQNSTLINQSMLRGGRTLFPNVSSGVREDRKELVSPETEIIVSQDHQREDVFQHHGPKHVTMEQAIENKQLACTLNGMDANSIDREEIGIIANQRANKDGPSATSPFILIPQTQSQKNEKCLTETESEADQTLEFSVRSGYFFTPFQSENEEYGDLQFNHLEEDEFSHADFETHSGYGEVGRWTDVSRGNQHFS